MMPQPLPPLPPPDSKIAAIVAAANEIPTLDAGPMLRSEAGAFEQMAADVRLIMSRLGFMSIVNHGVPWSLVDNAVAQTFLLFHLPEEERLKSRARHHHQGYWPSGAGRNNRTFEQEAARKSYGSGWALFRERADDDADALAGKRHRVQNIWPDPGLLPGFKPALLAYTEAMLGLSLSMVRVFARTLDLPADYLDGMFAKPEYHIRLNYYPSGRRDDAVLAASAHYDHSFFTLLPMSPVPGLQVQKTGREISWIDVIHVKEAILVNTGEWLKRMSNGRILPTPHRVVNPPIERVTVPFFMNTSDDIVCKPLPNCLASGESAKFDAIAFHDFFEAYLDGSYINRS